MNLKKKDMNRERNREPTKKRGMKEIEDEELLNEFDDDYSDLDDGLDNNFREISSAQSNLLKSMMDFDSRLKSIVSSWLGIVWDEEKQKYVPNPYSKQIMNHHGVSWFVDLFRTYLDKTNTLTSITKKAYVDIMEDVIDLTWNNLKFRMKEFGIENQGDLLKIGMQVEHSVSLMLLSLRGAGIKGVLRDNYKFQEEGDEKPKRESLFRKVGRIFAPREDF